MIYTIPVDPTPNQFLTTTLEGKKWDITLESRLGNIYISLNDVLYNRVCLHNVPVGYGFVFIDINETNDPQWEGLGSRYVLVWDSEA